LLFLLVVVRALSLVFLFLFWEGSWCLANGVDGRVAPRSGLAAKHSIDVGAGVIDADYRGELKVLLFNLSDVDFTVGAGERVAQLVLERVRCSLFSGALR
jgi:deoxyuridine 5'-triphosphate nucleotidohydrolase